MAEPQHLTALEARPPSDVATMAVAVQANLVQLKVACTKRADLAGSAHEIQVPPPGAVDCFTSLGQDTIGRPRLPKPAFLLTGPSKPNAALSNIPIFYFPSSSIPIERG